MKNFTWNILLGVATIVTLWFAVKSAKELQRYLSFSKQVPIEVHEWGHSSVGKGAFGVRASYTYVVDGQKYGGTHVFTTPLFMNAEVVDKQLHKWKGLRWQAWYSPKHPEKSTLQHNYPIKSTVQAILALGILIYFAWLRMFVQRTV